MQSALFPRQLNLFDISAAITPQRQHRFRVLVARLIEFEKQRCSLRFPY